jgi:hypothetical protein
MRHLLKLATLLRLTTFWSAGVAIATGEVQNVV